MTSSPGPTFDRAGKYRLGALLGEGGMAQVYRGAIVSSEGFEREVAIKRVLPEWSAHPTFFEMFKNEAWLASMLHHDNIVAVLDFDRDIEGRVFQVLEFVRGRDLEKLASTGPVPMPVAAYIMGEVLRGLDHAHRATNPSNGRVLGIVHRDCTPSNVLITYEGRVKLSDFGVAKAVLSTQATQSGLPKGKPAYMSPEQLEGVLDLDGRSDLFAVGVMLWELLAHRRLFTGDTHHQVMSKVLLYGKEIEPLPALGQINPQVPAGLVDLINDLLAPKRSQRPVEAASALARLRPWIPVDGAEQLAALLASRFPGEGNQSRSASQLATVHGSYGPAGTSISGQNTTAATAGERVKKPGGRSRTPIALVAGASTLVLVLVAVVLATSGTKKAGLAPASPDAAERSAIAVPTPATPVDAGVADAPAEPADLAAPAPVDAGAVLAAPAIDAGTRRNKPGTATSGSGKKHEIVEMNLGGDGK